MSKLLQDAVAEFAKLPGIGRRTALRLTMHLLKMEQASVEQMVESIARFRREVRHCELCNNLSDAPRCPICENPERDHSTICVVEQVGDLMSIENTRQYRGLYHVLGGVISPMDKIGPEQLHVRELMQRLASGEVEEVILATNPDVEGETTATYLARTINPLGVTVSRLASGLPVGGDLEYADEVTLGRAIEARRRV
jgi:recombination protein RecR